MWFAHWPEEEGAGVIRPPSRSPVFFGFLLLVREYGDRATCMDVNDLFLPLPGTLLYIVSFCYVCTPSVPYYKIF
jgi:hypothetical protein